MTGVAPSPIVIPEGVHGTAKIYGKSTPPPAATETMEETDSDLIAKTADGDARAFTILVKKYQQAVLSTAFRYLGDSAAAEDVGQEVFIKVWRHARGFKGRSAFSTWLYRIAVNECLNFRVRRNRKQTLPLSEATMADGPGVAEKYEQERKARIVRRAVGGLPDRQRMALILSRFEGYSYEEIAAIMQVSVPTVESLIFRAKTGLKDRLLKPKREGLL